MLSIEWVPVHLLSFYIGFCHSPFSPSSPSPSAGFSFFCRLEFVPLLQCPWRTTPLYCFGSTVADALPWCRKTNLSFSVEKSSPTAAWIAQWKRGLQRTNLIQFILHNDKLKPVFYCLFEVWFGLDAEQKQHTKEKERPCRLKYCISKKKKKKSLFFARKSTSISLIKACGLG